MYGNELTRHTIHTYKPLIMVVVGEVKSSVGKNHAFSVRMARDGRGEGSLVWLEIKI